MADRAALALAFEPDEYLCTRNIHCGAASALSLPGSLTVRPSRPPSGVLDGDMPIKRTETSPVPAPSATAARWCVFATRGSRRVNPIGLSLVRTLEIGDAQGRFAGVDLLDGTPVIDIKPYVTRFDPPYGDPRCGWFDTVTMQEGITPAELGRPVAERARS